MSVENRTRVAVRCRPLVGIETDVGPYNFLTCDSEQKQIELDKKLFNYDYVFDSTATQADVYDGAVTKLTEKFLSGLNASIIAYGQTGSGKTHTMGTNDRGEDAGIIPRTLRQIFESTDAETNVVVKVAFLEVYNEDVYDLLKDGCPKISLREDVHSVKAREVLVQSYEDAMVCLLDGVRIRKTGATAMNTYSSRSHTIFSVILETNETSRCQMMLVDLAGSEPVKKTKTVGNRFKEGVNINKGLFVLGSVVNALSRDKGSGYIPYRDSTLTKLLKNCLQGNGELLMIVCISPLEESVQETTNSLKFAERALAIEVKPHVQSRVSDSWSGRKKAVSSSGVGGSIQTSTPFSTIQQKRPFLGSSSKFTPIPAFNLDSSPSGSCITMDEPMFKKPRTPERPVCSSFPKDLFSPLVKNICSTIESSMERVADRLVLGSRNVINTPVRESIVDAVVHRITIARRHFGPPVGCDGSETTIDDFMSIQSKNVYIPPRSHSTRLGHNLTIESKENVSEDSENMTQSSVMDDTVLLRRSTRSKVLKESVLVKSDRTMNGSVNYKQELPRRFSRRSTVKGSSVCHNSSLNVEQSILMTSSRRDVHTADILNLLNKASAKELQRLPCVGPKSAIILYNWRITNGPFRDINEVRSIPGLLGSFFGRFVEANMCISD